MSNWTCVRGVIYLSRTKYICFIVKSPVVCLYPLFVYCNNYPLLWSETMVMAFFCWQTEDICCCCCCCMSKSNPCMLMFKNDSFTLVGRFQENNYVVYGASISMSWHYSCMSVGLSAEFWIPCIAWQFWFDTVEGICACRPLVTGVQILGIGQRQNDFNGVTVKNTLSPTKASNWIDKLNYLTCY